MTITRTTSTAAAVTYPELGLTSESSTASVTARYDIARISEFDGKRATAEYTVSIGDSVLTEPFRLNFAYSGSGNPWDQAETELQSYFAKLDAETTVASDTATA